MSDQSEVVEKFAKILYDVEINSDEPSYPKWAELTKSAKEAYYALARNLIKFGYSLVNVDDKPRLNINDPVESVLEAIAATNRRKRADYALDDNPFSNFEESSRALGVVGFGPVEAALFNVCQKLARLQSLRLNGRMSEPSNEAVEDTFLDLATYSVIALALYRRLNDARIKTEKFQTSLTFTPVLYSPTDVRTSREHT